MLRAPSILARPDGHIRLLNFTRLPGKRISRNFVGGFFVLPHTLLAWTSSRLAPAVLWDPIGTRFGAFLSSGSRLPLVHFVYASGMLLGWQPYDASCDALR